MRYRTRFAIPFLLWFISALPIAANGAATTLIEHNIYVSIDPATSTLRAEDHLTLPPSKTGRYRFSMHEGFAVETSVGELKQPLLDNMRTKEGMRVYQLHLPQGVNQTTLLYQGRIEGQLFNLNEGVGKARQVTQGIIGKDGVVLDGRSGWYPYIEGSMQRFALTVTLPEGWLAVSQGQGPRGTEGKIHWQESQPQDDIYLIAAPFHLYEKAAGKVQAQVYLRGDDPALAKRYLDATVDYLALYSRLIGPYPYAKFALVENFWETGYGMPSFTLIGPRVIRFPFILASSYPHEILHNWWGNSVYVDYDNGNWCEGLTSYLADHLLKEREGAGEEYRRTALQRYGDFVHQEQDFPLVAFRGRHSESSQAIGYGKSMMLFHMLRRQLGDDIFIEGLRRFYRDNQFRVAGFDQLRETFETVSGQPLQAFFAQWTQRIGVPALALEKPRVEHLGDSYKLTAILKQTQNTSAFDIQVPLVVVMENGETQRSVVSMQALDESVEINTHSRPVQILIDPQYDVFRRLDPSEVPPSLSNLLGAERGMLILPAGADKRMLAAYRNMAEAWAKGYPGLEVMMDDELEALPINTPVWLLGKENRFRDEFAGSLGNHWSAIDTTSVEIRGKTLDLSNHSVALVTHPAGRNYPLAWISVSSPDAIPGLTRKLPHYGKYSYLAFEGNAPDNILKGQWTITQSAMQINLAEPVETLPLKPLPALTEANNY